MPYCHCMLLANIFPRLSLSLHFVLIRIWLFLFTDMYGDVSSLLPFLLSSSVLDTYLMSRSTSFTISFSWCRHISLHKREKACRDFVVPMCERDWNVFCHQQPRDGAPTIQPLTFLQMQRPVYNFYKHWISAQPSISIRKYASLKQYQV